MINISPFCAFQKNIISSNGNHMCLSLQGAVIEKGDKISSRKNVYKISCSDGTDVLIQAEKMVEAEDWYLDINAVIQNLVRHFFRIKKEKERKKDGTVLYSFLILFTYFDSQPQESNMASNSPSPLLDNPSKIGRTKSLKGRLSFLLLFSFIFVFLKKRISLKTFLFMTLKDFFFLCVNEGKMKYKIIGPKIIKFWRCYYSLREISIIEAGNVEELKRK